LRFVILDNKRSDKKNSKASPGDRESRSSTAGNPKESGRFHDAVPPSPSGNIWIPQCLSAKKKGPY